MVNDGYGIWFMMVNIYIIWLVVEPTPLKNMLVSWGPGVMTFPTEWKVIKVMFQTTDQLIYGHIVNRNFPTSKIFFPIFTMFTIWLYQAHGSRTCEAAPKMGT